MIRLPQYGALEDPGRRSETFEDPHEMLQELPTYESHTPRRTASLIANYHD